MKRWLGIAAAILVPALTLYAWHRRVVIWEHEAKRHEQAIGEVLSELQTLWQDTSVEEAVLIRRTAYLTDMLKRRAEGAREHLAVVVPLRNDVDLKSALNVAGEATRRLDEERGRMMAVAIEKKAGEQSRETAAWQAVATRHLEGLQQHEAAVRYAPNPAERVTAVAKAKAALFVAGNHLERAPAGAAASELKDALARLRKLTED